MIRMDANDTGLLKAECRISGAGYFPLAEANAAADICISDEDFIGVAIAAKALPGGIKPMEFPIEYFLDLAYDMKKWGVRNRVKEYMIHISMFRYETAPSGLCKNRDRRY